MSRGGGGGLYVGGAAYRHGNEDKCESCAVIVIVIVRGQQLTPDQHDQIAR